MPDYKQKIILFDKKEKEIIMRKQILHAAILATTALAFTGIAQAGMLVDNNVDGIAQYKNLKEGYSEPMKEKHSYRRIVTEDEIGNPAHKEMVYNVSDIEPAAGEERGSSHKDTFRYNN